MAARNQLGIKQLMDAEAEAQEIVNKARKEKVQLLKQAQDEAAKEIAAYRAQRQQQFEKFSAEQLSGTDIYTRELAKQTEETIKKLQYEYESKSKDVIQMLLHSVTDVHTEADVAAK